VIKALIVDLEHVQRLIRNLRGHAAVRAHLGKVADPTQEPVWRSVYRASVLRFPGALGLDLDPLQFRRTCHDPGQVVRAVEFKALHDAEAIAQR